MNLTASVASGFVGTVPMSIAMLGGRELLPVDEQYALPPHEITGEVAEQVGLGEHLEAPEHYIATVVGHFAYGAAAAIPYALIEDRIDASPAVKGAAYGLGLWAASYLGWLPAAGILRPATQHPAGRNLLMIGCHLIWGAATALTYESLKSVPANAASYPHSRTLRQLDG